MKDMPKRIVELRKKLNLTQEQVIDRCMPGVITQSHLSKIERGELPNVSMKKIKAIADALETSVDYLIYGVRDFETKLLHEIPGYLNSDPKTQAYIRGLLRAIREAIDKAHLEE